MNQAPILTRLLIVSLLACTMPLTAQNIIDRAAIYERKWNPISPPNARPTEQRREAVHTEINEVQSRNMAAMRATPAPSGKSPAAAPAQEAEPFGWSFSLDTGAIYDTSAFDDYTQKADWIWETNLGIGVEHAINEKLGYSIGGSAAWDRYDHYSELDVDVLGGSAGLSYKVNEKVSLGLDHSALWIYTSGYGDNFLTLHDTTLSTTIGLTDSLSLKLSATRRTATPSAADRWAFGSSLSYTWKLDSVAKDLSLNVGTSVLYANYDSPSDREAWATKGWVKLTQKLSNRFTLTLAASYLHNDDSTFSDALGIAPLDYDKWAISPTIAFTYVW